METDVSNLNFKKVINTCQENKLEELYNFFSDIDNYYKITKSLYKPIKLKLLPNWTTSEKLTDIWCKFSKDGIGNWENISLTTNEIPDYYIVINAPPPQEIPPPEKTIILRMEPNMQDNKQFWGEWAKPENKGYILTGHNNFEWHLSKSYKFLINDIPIKKYDFCVSTILSGKYYDVGHIKRVDFVKFMDQYSTIPIIVYGNNRFNYKEYRGSLPECKKDDGLFPYKYTFNCENNFIENYITEKLIDGILSECLTFYYGCPNVKEIIDERAFVLLDLNDFEKSRKIIEEAIENDLWSQRIEYIREAKKKILTEQQFFPRMFNLLTK